MSKMKSDKSIFTSEMAGPTLTFSLLTCWHRIEIEDNKISFKNLCDLDEGTIKLMIEGERKCLGHGLLKDAVTKSNFFMKNGFYNQLSALNSVSLKSDLDILVSDWVRVLELMQFKSENVEFKEELDKMKEKKPFDCDVIQKTIVAYCTESSLVRNLMSKGKSFLMFTQNIFQTYPNPYDHFYLSSSFPPSQRLLVEGKTNNFLVGIFYTRLLLHLVLILSFHMDQKG